jgi:hypothetical protein
MFQHLNQIQIAQGTIGFHHEKAQIQGETLHKWLQLAGKANSGPYHSCGNRGPFAEDETT